MVNVFRPILIQSYTYNSSVRFENSIRGIYSYFYNYLLWLILFPFSVHSHKLNGRNTSLVVESTTIT